MAWQMRLQNPPVSWAHISRAFGLKGGQDAAIQAFADACDARGMREIVGWEINYASVPSEPLLRLRLEGKPHEYIEDHIAILRRWQTFNAMRRSHSTPCPHCNGLGRVALPREDGVEVVAE